MDRSDWSCGIRYQNFDTQSGTDFEYEHSSILEYSPPPPPRIRVGIHREILKVTHAPIAFRVSDLNDPLTSRICWPRRRH